MEKKRLIFETIFILMLLSISLYLIANVSGYSFLASATGNVSTTPGNGTYLKNSTTEYINCTVGFTYVPGGDLNITFRNATLYVANTTNGSQLTSYSLVLNSSNLTATSTINAMYNGSMPGKINGTANVTVAVTWNINQTFTKPGPWIYNCKVAAIDVGQLGATDVPTATSLNWSTNKTIVMDFFMPNITAVGPVNSSGITPDSTWSDATVNFTVTAVDENIANCSLYGDFTGEWLLNKTITVSRDVQADVVELTLPTNSTGYRWAIKCDDKAGWYKYNTTLGYNVTTGVDIMPYNAYLLRVDGDAPSITLTPSASKTLTLGVTEAVKCEQGDNAGAGDVTLTIDNVEQTCDEGQRKATCTSSYRAGVSGAFKMKCVANDILGNGVSKEITLTVEDNTAPGPPTPTGDYNPPGIIEDITIEPTLIASGPDNPPFNIIVQGVSYPVEVTGVTATTATISTGPSSNTYAIGESKELDLNNDGVSDIELKLDDLSLGKALFSIKEVEVSMPGEAGPSEEGPEEEVGIIKRPGVIIGIIIAIIVILAGLYYFTRKK